MSDLIPGPDPGACPDCGAWRRAGVVHECEDWIDQARVNIEYAHSRLPYDAKMEAAEDAIVYDFAPCLLACAEALAELVDLHARFFDEDEASPVWERAYRARRGEA